MKQTEVLTILRQHTREFEQMGIKSLALFGSVARDEASVQSDVDILVEFTGQVTFDKFMDTKFFLEDLLQRKVDLALPQAIKPRLRPYILKDLVHVTG